MPPAGPDRIESLPRNDVGLGQPAVGLHEQHPDPGEFGGHLIHVAAKHRGQVGVDHGGVAPGDKPHQRADLMRLTDLCKPEPSGDPAGPLLVVRVAVAVHEDDRGGAEPVGVGQAQRLVDGSLVQRADQLAVGADPLGNLDHAVVELPWQHDAPVEDPGPALVGDAQRVAESLGDQQDGRLALPLEQRVGGDGGAEPHGADLAGGNRGPGRQPEQPPDARDGRVPVGGAYRQQLVRGQGPVRPPGHDVGERPAPVNPEVPQTVHRPSLSRARTRRAGAATGWGRLARAGSAGGACTGE